MYLGIKIDVVLCYVIEVCIPLLILEHFQRISLCLSAQLIDGYRPEPKFQSSVIILAKVSILFQTNQSFFIYSSDRSKKQTSWCRLT